jgi:hypothetical protein
LVDRVALLRVVAGVNRRRYRGSVSLLNWVTRSLEYRPILICTRLSSTNHSRCSSCFFSCFGCTSTKDLVDK